MDLAQFEPGVQIQDGGNFDPTKNGFSSISFGGRFGRSARIQVDGVDTSDENVGTTTEDIPASAISEFSVAQSTLDLSNSLTSSGAVNVVTKSGTNAFHGEGFGVFRDSSQAAVFPGDGTQFQRSQYGGDFGGAIIKDKLFFFIDGEKILQHQSAGVLIGGPLSSLAALSRHHITTGKLWAVSTIWSPRTFARSPVSITSRTRTSELLAVPRPIPLTLTKTAPRMWSAVSISPKVR